MPHHDPPSPLRLDPDGCRGVGPRPRAQDAPSPPPAAPLHDRHDNGPPPAAMRIDDATQILVTAAAAASDARCRLDAVGPCRRGDKAVRRIPTQFIAALGDLATTPAPRSGLGPLAVDPGPRGVRRPVRPPAEGRWRRRRTAGASTPGRGGWRNQPDHATRPSRPWRRPSVTGDQRTSLSTGRRAVAAKAGDKATLPDEPVRASCPAGRAANLPAGE